MEAEEEGEVEVAAGERSPPTDASPASHAWRSCSFHDDEPSVCRSWLIPILPSHLVTPSTRFDIESSLMMPT